MFFCFLISCKGLCSIRGVFPQLQSGAQLIVDGHKLLASGLNVSASDGRLALLLSVSPPASNETGARSGLSATLTAQFKGQIIRNNTDVTVETCLCVRVCCSLSSPLFT